MRNTLLVFFAIFSMLLACQDAMTQQDSRTVLRIDGDISQDTFEKITRFLNQGGKDIVVNSLGGDVASGQAIASALLGLDISVSVEHYCLSSCANYLFLAANRKSLKAGAVLGFHGGAGYPVPTQEPNVAHAALPTSILKLQEMEKKVFEMMNVDYRLISKSFELVKSDQNRIYVEFNGDDATTKIFDLSQKSDAAKLITERIKIEPKTTWRMRLVNVGASSKMYFPSEQTLRNAGVKGIEQYPYPKSNQEMAQLATELGIELVGDLTNE